MPTLHGMLKVLTVVMAFLFRRSTSLSAALATSRAASRLLTRRVQHGAAMTALRPPSWEVANQPSPDGPFESVQTSTAAILRSMPRSNAESVQNIIALLRSDAVKGIGAKLASALTTRFGERTLEVLRGEGSAQDEAALRAIPGLREKTIANVRRTVHQWEGLRKALDFGRSLGCLSEVQVSALASQHGERTEAVVREDPYVLLELFPTLRFRAVDFLARNALQVPADAPSRSSAALRSGLRRALGRGHCCAPRQRLLSAAAKELQLDELPYDAALRAAEGALTALVARGAFVEERPPRLHGAARTPPPMVSLAVMQAAERHVADAVRRRIARPEGAVDALFGRYDAVDVHDPWADAPRAAPTDAAAAGAGADDEAHAGLEARVPPPPLGAAMPNCATFGAGALSALSGGGPLTGAADEYEGGPEHTEADLGAHDDALASAAAARRAGISTELNATLQALSPLQRHAVERAGMGKLMVLTPGPNRLAPLACKCSARRFMPGPNRLAPLACKCSPRRSFSLRCSRAVRAPARRTQCAPSSRVGVRRARRCFSRRRPRVRPTCSPRPSAAPPRPFTGCLSTIRGLAASVARPPTRCRRTRSSWTRRPCSTCTWRARSSTRCPPRPPSSSWATTISSHPSALAPCFTTCCAARACRASSSRLSFGR